MKRVVLVGLAAFVVAASGLGCTSTSERATSTVTEPVPATTLPPPSTGWSPSFAALDAASMCARGFASFCPPPPEVVEPTTTLPADPCAGSELCAAFATPEGRVMPGPKPPGVSPIVSVPDTYEGWDVSREPGPFIDIPPVPPTTHAPPVVR